MKAALASSTVFFDSAEISLARFPAASHAIAEQSRRALLTLDDRAGGAFEIILRVFLGSSLLVALGQCIWQLAQH